MSNIKDLKINSTVYEIHLPKTRITDFPESMPASDVKDWAKADTKPTYTADEVGALPDTTIIPSIEGLETTEHAEATYQPIGDYLTKHLDISGKVDKVEGKQLSTNDFTNVYKSELDSKGLANGLAVLDANGKIASSYLPTSARQIKGQFDAENTHELPDISSYSDGDELLVITNGYYNTTTAFTLVSGGTLTDMEVALANLLISNSYVFTLMSGDTILGTVKSFANDSVTLSDDTVVSLPYTSDLIATSEPSSVLIEVKIGDEIIDIDSHWIHLSNTSTVDSVNGKKGAVVLNASDVSAISSDNLVTEFSNTTSDSNVPSEKLVDTEFKKLNWIKGKVINFLGDSITYGHDPDNSGELLENPYPKLVGEILSCTTNNYGIKSSTLATGDNSTEPMATRVSSMDTTAVMNVLMGGTNDLTHSIPLGTINDTDTTTVYGALNTIALYWITNMPNAINVFCSNLKRKASTETSSDYLYTLSELNNAIKLVAYKYSFMFIDCYNEMPMYAPANATLSATWSSGNYTHPNLAFVTNIMAPFIAHRLVNLNSDDGVIINDNEISETSVWSSDKTTSYFSSKVTLYIDNVNGNDNNDGLTTNTPIKTISESIINDKCPLAKTVALSFMDDYTGDIVLPPILLLSMSSYGYSASDTTTWHTITGTTRLYYVGQAQIYGLNFVGTATGSNSRVINLACGILFLSNATVSGANSSLYGIYGERSRILINGNVTISDIASGGSAFMLLRTDYTEISGLVISNAKYAYSVGNGSTAYILTANSKNFTDVTTISRYGVANMYGSLFVDGVLQNSSKDVEAIYPETAEVVVYVDNVNGSDDNDGLSTDTPIKTIDYLALNKKFFMFNRISIMFMSDYTGNITIENGKIIVIKTNDAAYTSNRSNDFTIYGTVRVANVSEVFLQFCKVAYNGTASANVVQFENCGVAYCGYGSVTVDSTSGCRLIQFKKCGAASINAFNMDGTDITNNHTGITQQESDVKVMSGTTLVNLKYATANEGHGSISVDEDDFVNWNYQYFQKATVEGSVIVGGRTMNNRGTFYYEGKRLFLEENRPGFTNTTIGAITKPDGITTTVQGCAVYGDTWILLFNNGYFAMYDLANFTGNVKCSGTLGSFGSNNHANCLTLGDKYDAADDFPLLYSVGYQDAISESGLGSCCNVDRLVSDGNGGYTSTLIQTIKIDYSGFESNGFKKQFPYHNFMVDPETGYLYTFGALYRTNGDHSDMDSQNRYYITKYAIPELTSQEVTLTAADVLSQWECPYDIDFTQGATIHGGKLFHIFGSGTAASSVHPNGIRVYDLMNGQVLAKIDCNSTVNWKIREPEALAVYKNRLMVIVQNCYLHYLKFN